MKKKVIIFGVSYTAATLMDGIYNQFLPDEIEIVGYLDDDLMKHGNLYFGYKVLGSFKDLNKIIKKYNVNSFAIGLADHRQMLIRSYVYSICNNFESLPINSIHEKAIITKDSTLGCGAFLMPNVYVGIGTKIGYNSSIHVGVSIAEDCQIGNNVMIAGNSFIGGQAIIGDNVYIGPGSVISSGAKIGSNTIIGGGSFVTKGVSDDKFAFGNPISKSIINLFYLKPPSSK